MFMRQRNALKFTSVSNWLKYRLYKVYSYHLFETVGLFAQFVFYVQFIRPAQPETILDSQKWLYMKLLK